MDSWSYGRSVFFANETLLPSDSFPQNRKSISGFDQRLSNELENDDVLMSELADRSFADLDEISAVSITKVASSSCVVPLNLLHEEEESSSSSKLSRIDFKLRSFLDYGNSVVNDVALPAKKSRAPNPCSQTPPLCQVYGCNMDLSSSKDYHKRHRVCETHSKTSVVIVSGIEQRFCQQCSRFHFLSEFDDGRRSCRRRLAGHNERRRKPSFYLLPGKRHKLLRPSQGVVGNKFLESSSVNDLSLVLPEAFPGNLLYRVMNEHDHHATRLMSSKYEPSSVSSIWNLHEAAPPPRSICALSLLSAQSQQETPNTGFSITQQNQTLNHQMEPLSWMINPGKKTSSGKGSSSSTVDLLQLSSHLQRIEQQRNFGDEVKQEYNDLYFPAS